MIDQNQNDPISFSRQFRPMGLAGATSAPANADEDSPPGAGGYASGPLANPPPQPTPTPPTLSAMANGGENHATAWMNGGQAPVTFQQKFPTNLSDMAGSMNGPAPAQPTNPQDVSHFAWASSFGQSPAY